MDSYIKEIKVEILDKLIEAENKIGNYPSSLIDFGKWSTLTNDLKKILDGEIARNVDEFIYDAGIIDFKTMVRDSYCELYKHIRYMERYRTAKLSFYKIESVENGFIKKGEVAIELNLNIEFV